MEEHIIIDSLANSFNSNLTIDINMENSLHKKDRVIKNFEPLE